MCFAPHTACCRSRRHCNIARGALALRLVAHNRGKRVVCTVAAVALTAVLAADVLVACCRCCRDGAEQLSVDRALRALSRAEVVVMVVDGSEGVTQQVCHTHAGSMLCTYGL